MSAVILDICNVYLQLIHNVVERELTQHCKAIILQIENKEGVGFHVTFSVISDLWKRCPLGIRQRWGRK